MPCLQAHEALPTSCPASVHPARFYRAAKNKKPTNPPEDKTGKPNRNRRPEDQELLQWLPLFSNWCIAQLKYFETMKTSAPMLINRFSCCGKPLPLSKSKQQQDPRKATCRKMKMDCKSKRTYIQGSLHLSVSSLRVFGMCSLPFALASLIEPYRSDPNSSQQNATKLIHRKPQPLAVDEAGEVTISEPVRLDILEPGKPS